MEDKIKDVPLSESSVTLKLELIQRRCSELLDSPDAFEGLSLEDESAVEVKSNDPYNRLRA
jgi:hypothetical protein